MAARTYAQQLAAVDAAIEAIETRGQRYEFQGRVLWRGDLATLHAERRRLTPLAERERSGRSGMRVRRAVPL